MPLMTLQARELLVVGFYIQANARPIQTVLGRPFLEFLKSRDRRGSIAGVQVIALLLRESNPSGKRDASVVQLAHHAGAAGTEIANGHGEIRVEILNLGDDSGIREQSFKSRCSLIAATKPQLRRGRGALDHDVFGDAGPQERQKGPDCDDDDDASEELDNKYQTPLQGFCRAARKSRKRR